jgi:hypothetical protein
VLGLTAVGVVAVAVAAGWLVVAVWVDGISERPRMGRAAVTDVSNNSTKATVQALCIIRGNNLHRASNDSEYVTKTTG